MMNYNMLARVKKFVIENLAEHDMSEYYSEVETEIVCEEMYPYEKNPYKISLAAIDKIIACC